MPYLHRPSGSIARLNGAAQHLANSLHDIILVRIIPVKEIEAVSEARANERSENAIQFINRSANERHVFDAGVVQCEASGEAYGKSLEGISSTVGMVLV